MSYQVPQHIDKNKIFIVKRSEIEGRLEPEFYKPSIACLEAKIRSLSSKRLRDYALSFAGGVTPKKSEGDKYYSDAENGVPFLRVQNLQTTGELSLDGCIYINENTHNGLLKRSQVSEGDLLIKITGVGRMAIAAVAPKDFVGNTNQHMVVVKTGNTDVSKYLAHYLNLDIIEKIASRHSTGGTRPALDYPSLKNIPIIEGLDFSLIDDAIKAKKAKEEEAKGNHVKAVEGGFRRIVASPHPVAIVEIDAIKALMDADQIVIACGGGGIPVMEKGYNLRGASAIIEKDLATGLLAKEIDADVMMILTSVDNVTLNFGTDKEEPIHHMTIAEAKTYMEEGQFEFASMLPKISASVNFLEAGNGRKAIITSLDKAECSLTGEAGTTIE